MEGACEIGRLPEECVSHVLSLTSPRDSCRSAAVSTAFRSAAASDNVWTRFLPSDHPRILSWAVDPSIYTSKKELYFRLCDSILIDSGLKSFALEKETGAKCFTLSARALSIAWGDDERYWKWVSLPESRFSKVAELLNVCWLDINGKIDSSELSSYRVYKAYLIFKLNQRSYGLDGPSQMVSLSVGAHIYQHKVCLNPDEDESDEHEPDEAAPAPRVPRERSDGWMEIEIGEFFTGDGDDGEVSMSFKDVTPYWKRGLIVEGIQVRPM